MAKKRLNDLDGKEWIKHSISWFTVKTPHRSEKQLQHPAKYPSSLAKRFIRLFTRENDWVLDPFAGTGSTLIGAWELGRNAIGIELNPDYAGQAEEYLKQSSLDDFFDDTQQLKQQQVIVGDALDVEKLIAEQADDQRFQLCMTSPPYWNMLKKKRGGSDSQHNQRAAQDLPLDYSDDTRDLGNIEDYDEFLEKLVDVFIRVKQVLADEGYLIVVLQNIRDSDQHFNPLAWEFALKMRNHFRLEQEQIWCQTDKTAGIWGYPTTYVSNVHHHYCLIFKNTEN